MMSGQPSGVGGAGWGQAGGGQAGLAAGGGAQASQGGGWASQPPGQASGNGRGRGQGQNRQQQQQRGRGGRGGNSANDRGSNSRSRGRQGQPGRGGAGGAAGGFAPNNQIQPETQPQDSVGRRQGSVNQFARRSQAKSQVGQGQLGFSMEGQMQNNRNPGGVQGAFSMGGGGQRQQSGQRGHGRGQGAAGQNGRPQQAGLINMQHQNGLTMSNPNSSGGFMAQAPAQPAQFSQAQNPKIVNLNQVLSQANTGGGFLQGASALQPNSQVQMSRTNSRMSKNGSKGQQQQQQVGPNAGFGGEITQHGKQQALPPQATPFQSAGFGGGAMPAGGGAFGGQSSGFGMKSAGFGGQTQGASQGFMAGNPASSSFASTTSGFGGFGAGASASKGFSAAPGSNTSTGFSASQGFGGSAMKTAAPAGFGGSVAASSSFGGFGGASMKTQGSVGFGGAAATAPGFGGLQTQGGFSTPGAFSSFAQKPPQVSASPAAASGGGFMAGATGFGSKQSKIMDSSQSPKPLGGGRQTSGDQRHASAAGFAPGSAQSISQMHGTQKFLNRQTSGFLEGAKSLAPTNPQAAPNNITKANVISLSSPRAEAPSGYRVRGEKSPVLPASAKLGAAYAAANQPDHLSQVRSMRNNAHSHNNQSNSISPGETRHQGAPNQGRDRQSNGAPRQDRNQQQQVDKRAPKRAQGDDDSDEGQPYDKSLFDNNNDDGYDDEPGPQDAANSYNDDQGDDGYGDEYGEDEQDESLEDRQKDKESVRGSPRKEAVGSGSKGKTEPCWHHLAGRCKYGDDCQRIHAEAPEISADQCGYFVREKAAAVLGGAASQRACTYGDACRKAHDEAYAQEWQASLTRALRAAKGGDEDEPEPQSRRPRLPISVIKAHDRPLKQPSLGERQAHSVSILTAARNYDPMIPPQPALAVAPVRIMPSQPQPQQAQPAIVVPPFQRDATKQVKYFNDPQVVAARLAHLMGKLRQIQQNPGQHRIPDMAHCLQMSPQSHIEDETYIPAHFERDRENGQYPLLAVMKFVRCAADRKVDDPDGIRPPIVLNLTVKYVRDCVVDQDLTPPGQSFYQYQKPDKAAPTHSAMDVYSFLKDRTREISKQLGLCMRGRAPDKYAVRTLEQMIRYMIIAMHDGYSDQTGTFVQKQWTEQMTGWQGDLQDTHYSLIKRSRALTPAEKTKILKHEVEMNCYQIIATAGSSFAWQRVVNQIGKISEAGAQGSKLLTEAIKIAQSIQNRDFQQFFKLYKATNYMFACLMLPYFGAMRLTALAAIETSQPNKRLPVRGAFVQKQLLLPDLGDCYECLRLAGFAPEQETCNFEPKHRGSMDDWYKFRQQKLPRLDAKAAFGPNRLRRDFIRQGISLCFAAGAAELDGWDETKYTSVKQQQSKPIQFSNSSGLPQDRNELIDPNVYRIPQDNAGLPQSLAGRVSEQPRPAFVQSVIAPAPGEAGQQDALQGGINPNINSSSQQAQSAELVEQAQRQQLLVRSCQKVQSQFRAFTKKLELQEAAKGRSQVAAKLIEHGAKAANQRSMCRRLLTIYGSSLLIMQEQGWQTWKRLQQEAAERERIEAEREAAILLQKQQMERKRARDVKRRQDFSDILRRMNREQANQNERHKRQRRLLRRWFDKVQKMKRYQELEVQQKVLEQFSRFLLNYDQVHAIEGLESSPYEINTKIKEKQHHQRINFATLNLKEKETLILLLINDSVLEGFDAKINKSVLDHFKKSDYPQLQIIQASTSTILSGGFSAVILIVHDLQEIQSAAKAMNQKANDNRYAQIQLNILAVNLDIGYGEINKLFRESFEAAYVGAVNLININVLKKHFNKLQKNGSRSRTQYVLDCVVKASLEDQCLLGNLGKAKAVQSDAAMIKCCFYDLLVHHCRELTADLSPNVYFDEAFSLGTFNHYLSLFHHCFKELVYPLSLCASDEFHHGDVQGKTLCTSEPLKFIDSLLSLQLLPDVTQSLEPKHLRFIYQDYFGRFPNLVTKIGHQLTFDGREIFKAFYEWVFQHCADSNWQITLLNSHISHIQPFSMSEEHEQNLKQPDERTVVNCLKRWFPRDFGQCTDVLGKRVSAPRVIDLDEDELQMSVHHENRRNHKARRKFGGREILATCIKQVHKITDNKIQRIAEHMHEINEKTLIIQDSDGCEVAAVSPPIQSPAGGSAGSPILLGSDREDLSCLSKSSASVPAAIVEVLSTDQESEDPFDLALSIQQRLKKSFFLGVDTQSDLDFDLQLLGRDEHSLVHEEVKEQQEISREDYGMSELEKIKQQILLLDE